MTGIAFSPWNKITHAFICDYYGGDTGDFWNAIFPGRIVNKLGPGGFKPQNSETAKAFRCMAALVASSGASVLYQPNPRFKK